MSSAGFEPYPFPGGARGGMSRAGAIASGTLIALAALYVGISNARVGEALQAVLTLLFGGVLALTCFGLAPQSPPRARFRLLNHVVMTRAERAPIDSWVHVAPTRAYRWQFVSAAVIAALGFLSMSVFAGLQAFGAVPIASETASDGGLFLGMLAMGVLGLVTAGVAWLLVWRSVRNGRFGARPSGVVLGPKTLSVRVPGRDTEFAWNDVVSVRAQVSRLGRREHVAVILIQLAPQSGAPNRMQIIPAERYTVPTSALYSALRWYCAHPEARWELGRTEGQVRLDGWCADAAVVAVGANVR